MELPTAAVKITGHHVIDPGSPGNKIGDKPIVVFDYEMAKKTDNMMDKIKKSGTVRSSAAFELDDLTTPVELVARENTAKKKWAHRHTNWRNPHRWKVSQERWPTAATFSERRKPHTFDLTTW